MSGFVYILRCGDFAKVGYSQDPEGRADDIMRSTPYEMSLLAMHPGTRADEARVHRHLAAWHHRHEWFMWCDRLEKIVNKGFSHVRTTKKSASIREPHNNNGGPTHPLTRWRFNNGSITLTRMSKKIGVNKSPSYLSRMERGQRRCPEEFAQILSAITGIPTCDFVNFRGAKNAR